MNNKGKNYYPIVIIGAGIAGSTAFYEISKFHKCLLIEKRDNYLDSPYYNSRVIVGHSIQFFPDIINVRDKEIFPHEVNVVEYSSNKEATRLFPHDDIKRSIGYNMDECAYTIKLIKKAEKNNESKVIWNSIVTDLIKNNNNECKFTIEITQNNKFQSNASKIEISTNLLVIATGSHSPELLKKMGFTPSPTQNFLSAHFKIKKEHLKSLENNPPMDYMYHRHPKASPVGPLVMTKGSDYFNLYLVSNESKEEMVDKFKRIIQNYTHIAPFFQHCEKNRDDIKESDFIYGQIGNTTLDRFNDDGIVLLGESAGLVTKFYNEGTMVAVGSAHLFAKIINKYNNTFPLPIEAFKEYEQQVRSQLLGNWERSQNANENLFVNSGQHRFEIWNAYIRAIKSDKKVRDNIYEAWYSEDIGNYNLENDEYCGEKIYKNLSLSKKFALTPFFLKLKFS